MLFYESMKLVLASGSPRRAELLQKAGFKFRVQPVDVDESIDNAIDPEKAALVLAQRKYDHFTFSAPAETVITADTIVAAENKILAKPADREEAIEMLSLLSGRTHLVITGVCIGNQQRSICFAETTEVNFMSLGKAEMEHYVHHYRPYDKAGAYGIQEWIGLIGISKITGCYYNVMGLPVHQLYKQLRQFAANSGV